MPRSARLEFPNACYHVINRGNYRQDLFDSDGACLAFEHVLFEACERFGWQLHAYVIMRNHFHLALQTPQPNLSVGMKWLQGTWVARFNRLRGWVGRPFQGRFKALHVEPGHALAEVAHYIHLNPVRAGIVLADDLAAFRWSSLHHFPAKVRPAFLNFTVVLGEAGGLSDSKTGWRNYFRYLAFRAAEKPAETDRRYRKLSRGWCIGSVAFRQQLKASLDPINGGEVGRFVGLEPAVRKREQAAMWSDQLEAAARWMQTDLGSLPPQKSAPPKVLLAAAMKSCTDVSNPWLAERLDMGSAANVSQFVRRFRLAGGEIGAVRAAILSIVKI